MRYDIVENKLRRIIRESVKNALNEAESCGWVVETDEARKAYDFACMKMGKEGVDDAIVRSLGDERLAESLAYVFRMYNFEEWKAHSDLNR